MPASVLPRPTQSSLSRVSAPNLAMAIVLTAWFALVVWLGATHRFFGPPGTPPIAIGIGFGAPVLVFFALLWLSHSVREWVLAADLRLMVAIQAWRFAGLGFLALYTHNVLPGTFALPTGLIDIAVGVTAPWMLISLIRQPRFVASRAFMLWNALGIADLVAAIGNGTVNSVLATGAAGEITTAPMAQLPLVLIPAFLVPIFLMLHAASLMQARRAARNLRGAGELVS